MPYVSTFRAPSEYEMEMERARRQQALAEALAQQMYQPTEGGAAPIPSAAPLVRALQSFMAGRAERKARESLERAKEMETQTGQQIAGRLMGTTAKPTIDDLTEVTPAGRIGPAVPSDLTEVQLESQYRYDPEGAMQKAMTPQGMAAIRGNPMLAAALQRSMEAPAAEEFYAPIATDKGLVQFGKRGKERVTGYQAPEGAPEAVTPTTIIKDGRRVVVDARTGREIGAAPESNPLVVNYGSPVAGVDEQGNPVFFQPSRTGGPPSMIPGVRPEGKAPTESQSNAMLFAERMAQAEPLFQNPPPTFGSRFKEGLPGGVGNVMITPESRQFFQAERNFINAVLRKESGAVISDTEFENARKQYIPQPGDDAATLELKRQARETAIRQIAAGGGAGYKPPSISGSQIIDLPPRRR